MKRYLPQPGPNFSLKRLFFVFGALLYTATVQWRLIIGIGMTLFMLPKSTPALNDLVKGWKEGELGSGVLFFLLQLFQYSWPALFVSLPTLWVLRRTARGKARRHWLILLAGTTLCVAITVARFVDALADFIEPDVWVVFSLCWPWIAAAYLVPIGANNRYLRTALPSLVTDLRPERNVE